MRLPDADDLFRPTAPGTAPSTAPRTEASPGAGEEAGRSPAAGPRTPRGASGRVKHDEKMTVYVTADELLDIENARLVLRRRHGVAVDRGRLVREAVALVLADLEQLGEESPLVRRLSDG